MSRLGADAADHSCHTAGWAGRDSLTYRQRARLSWRILMSRLYPPSLEDAGRRRDPFRRKRSSERCAGSAAPIFGSDVGNRLAEGPPMTAKIFGHVLPFAVGEVGGEI